MLTLRRKVDETILIETPAGPVTLMLVDVCGQNAAKIGIEAPAEWKILRGELVGAPRKEGEGRRAA